MHLIYKNLLKNLILLWTGEFKGLDEGQGSYQLKPKVWEAIGIATAASGSTIPGAFGQRPPNCAEDKTSCTADTWSFWMLYIGPVLLARKFKKQIYYDHFVELVKLINICLQFEISRDQVSSLRVGFKNWVEKYEESVFCFIPLDFPDSGMMIGCIISMTPIAWQPVLSRCMLSFTLLMELKSAGRCGPTGPSQWSDIVVHCSQPLRVVDIRIPQLMPMLWHQRSLLR